MDAQNASTPSTLPTSGGTVEPVTRAAAAKDKLQKPETEPRERYELRDPFAETTYRSYSLAETVAKADQLGSTRFTALASDGTRTPIVKSGGEWHRAAQLPALPARPIEPVKDEPEPLHKGKATQTRETTAAKAPTPQVATRDKSRAEVTTQRTVQVAELEAALRDRYVIKRAPLTVGPVMMGHTEYRFRGDTSRVAFTESTLRLSTDTNSPSVARSMVDVAQARNWKGLRVSGSEDFRRLVWLEASVRGVKAIGYEPNPADIEILKRERDARQLNRIEPVREPTLAGTSAVTEKASARGNNGRKPVLSAIEAVLIDKGVPAAKRQAVLAAASEQLVQRARAGHVSMIRVYDKGAPSQRPSIPPAKAPVREINRSHERAAPARVR